MYKFVSKSHACVNVAMSNGANVHVSFSPITGGSSVYYTDDEALAAALRSHYRFGKLFKEEKVPEVVKVEEVLSYPAEEGGEEKAVQMEFSCNDDAKDYLADKYGVSRSKMRSRANIESVAAANGINIKWVDE